MKNSTNQSGRSMIEMLGVLAIVGVLSVGGIAGYSKAMQKYRTNKTIEQVTQIINGVRTLYSQQKNYDSINAKYKGPLCKAKILPEQAWESTEADNCPKNPFGGEYGLFPWGRKSDYDNKAVVLHVNDIPGDACIELATQDWGVGEGLFALSINEGGLWDFFEGCSGRIDGNRVVSCAGGSTMPLPIPIDVAVSACASNNDNNGLYFLFY